MIGSDSWATLKLSPLVPLALQVVVDTCTLRVPGGNVAHITLTGLRTVSRVAAMADSFEEIPYNHFKIHDENYLDHEVNDYGIERNNKQKNLLLRNTMAEMNL